MKKEIKGFKLLTRTEFREGVLSRSDHKCVVCASPAVDAHHIVERRLWTDEGYYLDNGAAVCEACHRKCETTEISLEQIRACAGVRKIQPDHFYDDTGFSYDKWGNIILPNGTRLKGELFYDESVQKILKQGDVLRLFGKYVKYPRTMHLPWSEGRTEDDRILKTTDHLKACDEIVVTLKMDGENCLSGTTRISLPNGERTTLRKLVRNKKVGDLVLGEDEKGNIVPTRITRVYNNGRTEDWNQVSIRVRGERPKFTYATDNHKFFVSGKGYVEVKDLIVGDEIISTTYETGFTKLQESVIIGTLLGDASLHKNYADSYIMQFSHKKEHLPYVNFKNNLLGKVYKGTGRYTSGFGTEMIKSYTVCSHSLYRSFGDFVSGDRKCVPAWVEDKLTPLAIAVWYMDDGSLVHSNAQRDRVQLSTCSFTEEDCSVLQRGLMKYGICSKQNVYDGYRYIDINADNAEIFFNLIASCVTPAMQYKLPASFRNKFAGKELFETEEAPKYYAKRGGEIVSIEKKSHRVDRNRYDLETETHNYFANGVLVHNCSMYNDYVHARSLQNEGHPSRDWLKGWHASIRNDIPDGWRICAENLFAKHSILYSDLENYVLGFSLWNEYNICMSWDDTLMYFELMGITPVQTLYRGPYDENILKEIAKNLDTEKNEGYVVRPARAFPFAEFRNVVGKYVRKNHVHTHGHWMREGVVKNKLVSDVPKESL